MKTAAEERALNQLGKSDLRAGVAPHDADVRQLVELLRQYPQLSQLTGAVYTTEDDLDADPTSERWSLAEGVLRFLDKQDPISALEQVEIYLETPTLTRSARAFLLGLRARVFRWQDDFTSALSDVKEAQLLDGATKFRATEALLLIQTGKLLEARTILESQLASKPTAYALGVYQMLLKKQGRHQDALDAFSKYPVVLTSDSKFDFEMHHAETLLLTRHTQEGIALLRELAGKPEARPAARVVLATFLTFLGNAEQNPELIDEAEFHVEKVLAELCPNRFTNSRDVEELKSLTTGVQAQILIERKKPQDAINLIESTPKCSISSRTNSILLMAYALAGRDDDGKRLIEKMKLEDEPHDSQFYYYWAMYQLQDGAGLTEIQPALDGLVAGGADPSSVLLLRSAAFTIEGRDAEALRCLQDVSFDQSAPTLHRSMAYGNAIGLCARTNDLDGAMEMVNEMPDQLLNDYVVPNAVCAVGMVNQKLSTLDGLARMVSHKEDSYRFLARAVAVAHRSQIVDASALVQDFARSCIAALGRTKAIERLHDAIQAKSAYKDELDTAVGDIAAGRDHRWKSVRYVNSGQIDIARSPISGSR